MTKNKNRITLVIFTLVILVMFLAKGNFPESQSIFKLQQEKIGSGGHGTGSNDTPLSRTSISGNPSILIGTYHSGSFSGSSPASISSQTTTFDLKDYPLGDTNNPDDYAKVIGEPKSQSRSEVLITVVNFGRLDTGGTVKITYYNVEGFPVFSFSDTIESPKDQNWCEWENCWWEWYTIFAWIGHFNHEINKPGTYTVKIDTSWGSETKYFQVIDTSPQCLDTDAKNEFTKGTVTYGTQSQTDICANSNSVYEFFCNNNQIDDTILNCQYGCQAGACLSQPLINKCTADSQCPTGAKCDTGTGLCIKTEVLDCRTTGCSQGFQCSILLSSVPVPYACTKETIVKQACGELGCPTGSICNVDTGICVETKVIEKDCRNLGCAAGFKCSLQNQSYVCSKETVIKQACGELGCSAGYVCNIDTGSCEKTIERTKVVETESKFEISDVPVYIWVAIAGFLLLIIIISSGRRRY